MDQQLLVKRLSILLILLMSGLMAGAAFAVTDRSPPSGTPEKVLLQYKAGNHLLGFTPTRTYLVGLGYALIEDFVGANPVVPVSTGGEGQAGEQGAPPFAGVQYRDLWQGITLNYRPTPSGLAESHYTIAPQAEVAAIRLRYNTPVSVQPDGTLRFAHPTQRGYFTQSAPQAWQEVGGHPQRIEVAFNTYDDHTLGFRVGEYDRQLPLIIDPTYEWHTFYGSSGSDSGNSIAVDGNDNILVTGESSATWNGDSDVGPLHAHSGYTDIFVLKLGPDGNYQWHTFYGSVNYDFGYGIAVDGSDNILVTGYSAATWNGNTGQAPKHGHSGSDEIVVLKRAMVNSGV